MKCWHEAPYSEIIPLIGQHTWQEIQERYKAPPWCSEGQAALSPLGCWTLITAPHVIHRNFCKTCDLYKEED